MEQFRDEMRAVWDIVDDGYNARVALGETASQAILTLAARASHHEFPFGMGVLAHLCACTNGALTNIFPGDPSPVVLPVVKTQFPADSQECVAPGGSRRGASDRRPRTGHGGRRGWGAGRQAGHGERRG